MAMVMKIGVLQAAQTHSLVSIMQMEACFYQMSVVLLLDYAISQLRTASDLNFSTCLHERQADEKVVITFSQLLPISKLWPKVKK